MRRILRNKIIEHFDSQVNFSSALRRKGIQGVDQTLISMIVREHRNPTAVQAVAFSEMLNMPIEELLKGEFDNDNI